MPNWSSETRSAFLQQQFQAQHAFYQLQYPDAAFMIILFDQLPIGRLYINRGVEDIRIIDITLLPDFRNHGYGEYLLNTFLDEADVSKKMVSIHVERNNRALNLYERLGFVVLEDNHPIYLLLGRPLKSK